jgi:hypothetical protein
MEIYGLKKSQGRAITVACGLTMLTNESASARYLARYEPPHAL